MKQSTVRIYDTNGIRKNQKLRSVSISATPTDIFDTSVTTSAGQSAITLSLDTQTANKVLSGATSGALATPSFRALVAADIGFTVPESKGGTNQSTYAQGDILYASAANTLSKLAKGTALQQLRMNSGATVPEWGDNVDVVDVQTFTTPGADTWTKPSGVSLVYVVCIGAGGGGGGGRASDVNDNAFGGGGGGGGAVSRQLFRASDLGSTVAINVASAGSGGAGGSTSDGSPGTAGGNSTFGSTLVIGFGGGGGAGGISTQAVGGGGGGGTAGAGGTGSGATGGTGGAPGATNSLRAVGGQGAVSEHNGQNGPGNAEWGGGAGSFSVPVNGSGTQYGGSSYFGGPGGGSGGSANNDIGQRSAGSAGGGVNRYAVGGGASGGSGANGTDGSTGTSGGCGTGGGGGGGITGTPGYNGGAGGAPGGGGGGGASVLSGGVVGGNGGNGSRGEVRVYSW